jgi:hypothetical protein
VNNGVKARTTSNAASSIDAPHHCTSCTDCALGIAPVGHPLSSREAVVERDRFGDQPAQPLKPPRLMTGLPLERRRCVRPIRVPGMLLLPPIWMTLESRGQHAMSARILSSGWSALGSCPFVKDVGGDVDRARAFGQEHNSPIPLMAELPLRVNVPELK